MPVQGAAGVSLTAGCRCKTLLPSRRRPGAGGLDLKQPLRVLDACAAPGGKTAHLLEHAPAGSPLQVTALEVDEKRSARIHDTLAQLGLSAQVLVTDASRPQDWWQSQCGGTPLTPSCWMRLAPPRASCAAILTCAGCGANRTMAQLAQLQRQILER